MFSLYKIVVYWKIGILKSATRLINDNPDLRNVVTLWIIISPVPVDIKFEHRAITKIKHVNILFILLIFWRFFRHDVQEVGKLSSVRTSVRVTINNFNC
jgi:hypothetical protein